jgi:signal transduction histidine kinase
MALTWQAIPIGLSRWCKPMQQTETGQTDSEKRLEPEAPAKKVRVLAVDDEAAMRETYRQVLGPDSKLRAQVDLAVCGQGEEAASAVQVAVGEGNPFAVVFLDVRMPPGWDGVRTAEAMRQADPMVNIVIVTAYSDVPQEDIAGRVPPADKLLYIQKPCHAPELRQLALALGAKWEHERSLLAIQRDLEGKVKRRTRRLEETVKALQEEAKAREAAQREAALNQSGLVQAQKLAAIGTLVSGMAHEVSNPNNIITLNAATLARLWTAVVDELDAHGGLPADADIGGRSYGDAKREIPELTAGIVRAADRITRLVKDLKGFARQEQPDAPVLVELPEVMEGALSLVMPLIRNSTRHFTVEREDRLPPVMGQARQLEQVLVNLLTNACQSLQDPDRAICVKMRRDDAAGTVCVEVSDEGCGIADRDVARVVEPFYTTKRDTGGTGLGLSVSDGIVRRHGGRLDIRSKRGKGTSVTVVLPQAASTLPV